jgi:hypothetical protein
LLSRRRHCQRCCFSQCRHHTSIFLRPFAPPALPGFFATTDALTSDCDLDGDGFRRCFAPRMRGGSSRPRRLWVRPACVGRLYPSPALAESDLPASRHGTFRPFHLQPPLAVLEARSAFTSRLTACHCAAASTHPLRRVTASLGLRHYLAGSPRQEAESSSSAYGPVVRLRLLPTPPLGDAVTFGYKVQTKPCQGLSP